MHGDARGAFSQWFIRITEPIVFGAPADNLWYDVPKNTGKRYFTEPYAYPVSGKDVQMASLVVPIIVDGHIIGAVGVSGVKSAEDAQVAKAGIAALN